MGTEKVDIISIPEISYATLVSKNFLTSQHPYIVKNYTPPPLEITFFFYKKTVDLGENTLKTQKSEQSLLRKSSALRQPYGMRMHKNLLK